MTDLRFRQNSLPTENRGDYRTHAAPNAMTTMVSFR